MTHETFAKMVNELGGPLNVASLIAEAARFGNVGTLRVSISRKVNGHERISPVWAALITLIKYEKMED